jgi:hypothetical protein
MRTAVTAPRLRRSHRMAFLLPVLAIASTMQAASGGLAAGRVPVLVELFTSEGCSSCPPADAALARLIEEQPVPGARIIALGEHVDYWDDLGWRDPYSSRVFSERQERYARRLGVSAPYTPQLVVGGRSQIVGSDSAGARAAVTAASRSPEGTIRLHLGPRANDHVVVEVEAHWRAGLEADVVLAAVEDRATTTVTGGENAGRTLTHVAIAKSLTVLGSSNGAFLGRATLEHLETLRAPRVIAFVQERGGGPVHAVGSIELSR